MANKKVYSIQINGLDESVKSVDALLLKLKDLTKTLDNLKKENIEIPVTLQGDLKVLNSKLQGIKQKVSDASSINGSSSSDDALFNKMLEERTKALEAVNREIITTNMNVKEFREQTKEFVAQEIRARNEAQGYANTLNGLKKELKDLNSTKGNLDIDSDEYKETAKRIYELTTRLKELEAAQGSYGRNVGNYTNGIINAGNALSNGSKQIAEYTSRINDLKGKIASLEASLRGFTVGSDEWRKAQAELQEYREELIRLQRQLDNVGNDQGKINIVVGDTVRQYSNMRQAAKQLQAELQNLSLSGKEDTKEFRDLVEAVKQFNEEAYLTKDRMNELTKFETPLDQMVQTFQGFGSIAQMGMGIQGLFGGGGNDSDSLKQIQQMQSLTVLMASMDKIQKEMAQGTTFGETLKKMVKPLESLLVLLGLSTKRFDEMGKMIGKVKVEGEGLQKQKLEELAVENDVVAIVKTLNEEYQKLREEIIALGASSEKIDAEGLKGLGLAINQLSNDGKISQEQWVELRKRFEELRQAADDANNNGIKPFQLGLGVLKTSFAYVVGGISQLLSKIPLVGKWFKSTSTLSNQAAASNLNLSNSLRAVASGMKAAELATKAFNMALKTFAIFALIGAIMELVNLLMDGIKWVYNWVKGNDTLVSSMNRVEGSIESTNKAIERYNKYVEKLVENHQVDAIQAATMMFNKLETEITKAGDALKEFNKDLEASEPKALEDNLSALDTWFQNDINDIEEFKKRFKELAHAVETGSGSLNSNNWLQNLWTSDSDLKTDFGEAQKRVIQDLQNEINKLDFSKKGDELQKDLKTFFNKVDSEMYQTSLKNIENLFPDEEWTKVLTERLNQVRNMYDQMVEYADLAGQAQIDIQRQIRDNYAEGISNEREREKQQLKNRRDDEIEAANGNLELIASINAKYDRLEKDRVAKIQGTNRTLKSAADIEKEIRDNLTEAIIDDYERQKQAILNAQDDEIKNANGNARLILAIKAKTNKKLLDLEKTHADDLYEVQRQIRDNLLSIEDESLDKRIKNIENRRADELRQAEKNQNATEELILSINLKYDNLIEKEKEGHFKRLNDLAEEYARKQEEINSKAAQVGLEGRSNRLETTYNLQVNSSQGNFDFDAQYGDAIEAEKRYNEERLAIELQYLEDKKQLDAEQITHDYTDEVEAERQSYQDRIKNLQDMHKNGELSISEYLKFEEQATKQHNDTLSNIETEKNNKLINLESQYLNERKLITSEALRDEVDLYEKYVQQVDDALKNFGQKKNIFGVTSFIEGKKQLDKAKLAVKQGLIDIQKEYDNLELQLKSGNITYSDYKQAKQQLQETEKTLKDEGKNIDKSLTELLSTVASEWKGMLDAWVGQVGSLLSTFNDIQMQLIENEIAMIDHQLELVEDAYSKAEEAAEKHKDKMNSIEDELSDARGARRQFLIDTLAAQEEAYQKDLAAQQKAEEDKQRLEEKQKTLEKKRKEQEKKSKIQQAIINTFMAVSNALSVTPWFVGAALSAVALALGMQQVNAIKATPVYGDGGLLQGPSHKQGGIKVLGGQAEVEGNEYVVNKKTTMQNLPLLNYINSEKRKLTAEDFIEFFSSNIPKAKTNKIASRTFAEGGQLPSLNSEEIQRTMSVKDEYLESMQVVVDVRDIINKMDGINKVQTLAGINKK